MSSVGDHLKTDDQQADSRSLTSVDSGLGGNQTDGGQSSGKEDDSSLRTDALRNTINKTKDLNIRDAPNRSRNESENPPGYGGTEEDILREFREFEAVPLEKLDNHTGILHVWLLILEGMGSTVSTCPKNYQPQTLEMLFELLRSAAQSPGIQNVNTKIKIAPSIDKGRNLIRILVTVSIGK